MDRIKPAWLDSECLPDQTSVNLVDGVIGDEDNIHVVVVIHMHVHQADHSLVDGEGGWVDDDHRDVGGWAYDELEVGANYFEPVRQLECIYHISSIDGRRILKQYISSGIIRRRPQYLIINQQILMFLTLKNNTKPVYLVYCRIGNCAHIQRIDRPIYLDEV